MKPAMNMREALNAVFDGAGNQIDAPTITESQRAQLRWLHRRVSTAVPVFREMIVEAEFTPASYSPPEEQFICAECKERWGGFGCPTIELLVALEHRERQHNASEAQLAAAHQALGALSVRGGWEFNKRRDGTLTISLELDAQTLQLTGAQAVAHFFAKVVREIRGRFEKAKEESAALEEEPSE